MPPLYELSEMDTRHLLRLLYNHQMECVHILWDATDKEQSKAYMDRLDGIAAALHTPIPIESSIGSAFNTALDKAETRGNYWKREYEYVLSCLLRSRELNERKP